MIETVTAWLASKGVSLILGYAFGFLRDLFNDWQAARAQKEAGRIEAERAQAQAGAEAQKRLADEGAKAVTEDDAIKQMERGGA